MENMENLMFAGVIIVLLVIAFVLISVVLAKLYKRASKEISFVRTGFGGQMVIVNGGALVFPILHEIIEVNMNTLRLEVQRRNEEALITRDRMRVDVRAEFYVRVKPIEEAIADAAQTLGRRTLAPTALKELVEGKFVDALRAVAAEMAMEELHEKRVDFVQKVQLAVSEDLLKNGLELESVSLTALDQTDQSYFNPQNAFDARGLTRLTEEIEARRKQRNDIEQDTKVAVQKKDLEAERQKLELARETEFARLAQQREIKVRMSEELTATSREQAEKEREAEEARIVAKKRVDQAAIMAKREVEHERIEMERVLREQEINKSQVLESAEILRKRSVEMTEQDRAIAIAEKSKAQSLAEAEADHARALSVKAAEEVITVRERERAEREKAIELVAASQEAEREAIGVTIAAQAEKKASEDRAAALRTQATAEADKVRIAAEADERRYQVDAAGRKALHEAENLLSPEIVAMRIKLAVVEHLAAIIREAVKPMERIEGIKIVQVSGLGGGMDRDGGQYGHPAGPGTGASPNGNLADQVVNSALRYRAQAPLLDSLLREVGLKPDDINGLTDLLGSGGLGLGPNGGKIDSDTEVEEGSAVADTRIRKVRESKETHHSA